MTQTLSNSEGSTPDRAPIEAFYPGLSPQLLARVRQLWSARGLELDAAWHTAVRTLPGYTALSRIEGAPSSRPVDLVLLFDQCVIWIEALHAAARCGRDAGTAGLTTAQWHGLTALSARLTEQVSALRMLALAGLPMPAMQIARSISEDVDMLLVLLVRRKLAERFIACRDVEEASAFWRRHIAGGRAFRTLAEKLYAIGLDHSANSDYGRWRKDVLTRLGAAVHSNALATPERSRPGSYLDTDSGLYFATFRLHELCAYAQLIKPDLTASLTDAASGAPRFAGLAGLAAPLSAILVEQIESLSHAAPADAAGGDAAG